MFEYDEQIDPVEQSKKIGKAFAQARHEADKRGVQAFLFHSSTPDEFDQRIQFSGIEDILDEVSNKYLTEVSDGRQKLAKSLKKEFEIEASKKKKKDKEEKDEKEDDDEDEDDEKEKKESSIKEADVADHAIVGPSNPLQTQTAGVPDFTGLQYNTTNFQPVPQSPGGAMPNGPQLLDNPIEPVAGAPLGALRPQS